MWTIKIMMRQSPTVLEFHFKEMMRARALRDALMIGTGYEDPAPPDWRIGISDDYGLVVDVLSEEIGGVILIDIAETLKGAIDMQIVQMRANADLQAKAQADPKLRFAAAGQGLRLNQ